MAASKKVSASDGRVWYEGLTSTQFNNGTGWCRNNSVSYEIWSGDTTQMVARSINGTQQELLETTMGLTGLVGQVVSGKSSVS
jgi:hypothetical protein